MHHKIAPRRLPGWVKPQDTPDAAGKAIPPAGSDANEATGDPNDTLGLQNQQTRRAQTERKVALNAKGRLSAEEQHRGKRSASANFSPAGHSSPRRDR